MEKELLEFTSAKTVIFRAICDFNQNDYSYKKDDIVLMYEDVGVTFSYNESSKKAKSGTTNIVTFSERKLNAVRITGASMTLKFIELFGVKKKEKFSIPVVEETILDAEDNEIVFYPSKDFDADKPLHIMGFGNVGYDYDAENRVVTLKLEEDDEVSTEDAIDIIYYSPIEKPTYDISDNDSLPYFSMEVIGEGNVNKETSNIYFKIPKVSLFSKPEYSLDSRVTSNEMIFTIVDDKENGIEVGVY